MKWVLFFCILSQNVNPISGPEILETFVSKNKCVQVREEKVQHALKINEELGAGNYPVIYLGCIPYTGPWKREVSYGKEEENN